MPINKEKGEIKFKNIDEMINYYHIDNIRELINLSDEELTKILSIMKVHNGKDDMLKYIDTLKDKHSEDKKSEIILEILQIFAEKYCRCLDNIKGSGEKYKYGICNKNIFNNKGLKGVGSNYQCNPIPMLFPSPKYILQKKI